MGPLEIIMSMKQVQRRWQIDPRSKPESPILPGTSIAASVAKRKVSPCQQDDYSDSEGAKIPRYSGPDLPADIWCRIHALLPMPDAARAACVSRQFLSCWRCRPNLALSEKILRVVPSVSALGEGKLARRFIQRVDGIMMKRHPGIGVKTFTLECLDLCIRGRHLNSWLQIAVAPVLEELVLSLPWVPQEKYYSLPCSLFSNGCGSSIRNLNLTCCSFHPMPMAGFGSLRNLRLSQVQITGDELGCLLSNSSVLEKLTLMNCNKITCLKIPCLLNQLSHLLVFGCIALEVIENRAPSLCTVRIDGALVGLPFGDSLQVKNLEMLDSYKSDLVHYACAELPRIMPDLETIDIASAGETLNTPVLPARFMHLKGLEISLGVGEGPFSPAYDYFSLVSLLDACPVLETFGLTVLQTRMKHDSVSGHCSNLRWMPERHHVSLKDVEIIGFCSAKSMVELTCHILDNAASLEHLKLDTIYDGGYETRDRLAVHEIGDCRPVRRRMIIEAGKALLAIEKYIVGRVPSKVKLNIKKPCSRCHVVK